MKEMEQNFIRVLYIANKLLSKYSDSSIELMNLQQDNIKIIQEKEVLIKVNENY